MKVKDIVDECMLRLRIVTIDGSCDCGYENMSECKMIIRILNYIIREIASGYIDYITTERLAINDDNTISLSSLTKACNKIKSIKIAGINKRFVACHDRIELIENTHGVAVEISYSYYPTEVVYSDDILAPQSVNDNMLICGIMTEYCMVDNRVEEALIYDGKYRDYLRNAMKTAKRVGVVKARRW